LPPFLGGNDEGQRVQFPGPVGALGVGVDVVGDAVFLDTPLHEGQAVAHLLRRGAVEMVEKRLPVRAHLSPGGQHFVVAPGGFGINGKKGTRHGIPEKRRL